MSEAKPFCISKKDVWEAYQRVQENKGAAGIDEQSIEDFEKKLKKNLYKIWNRMSSGSYFPPPVRTVKIPKKNGGERKLGIPTVADRIAQQVVKARLEPELEPVFHADSYGYRPGFAGCRGRIGEIVEGHPVRAPVGNRTPSFRPDSRTAKDKLDGACLGRPAFVPARAFHRPAGKRCSSVPAA